MLTNLVGFLLAFIMALVLTPFVIPFAKRVGAVDRSEGKKIHAHDLPRLGGIAIVLAFYVPILALTTRLNAIQHSIYEDPRRIETFLYGGAAIFALGVYDDLAGANAKKKLLVQTIVAVSIWFGNFRILGSNIIEGHQIMFWNPLMSLFVTVLWVVGIINALNLVDGLDGLASGVAVIVLMTTALCAQHRHEHVLTFVALCLGGSVCGFLFHNFHPAKIFMGDSGSMFLGYVIATTSIWSFQKTATVISTLMPLLIVGLPILEVALTILRRVIARRGVFDRDLDHIHYRLISQGWSQPKSVILLYTIQLVFCLIALYVVFSNNEDIRWPAIAGAVVIAIAFARWLGYRFSR